MAWPSCWRASKTWGVSSCRPRCGSEASILNISSGPPGRFSRRAIRRRPNRSSSALLRQVATGNAPHELEGSLHLLSGEIHQAKRTPDELNKAVAEFEKALATGQQMSSTVVVRLAQIDVQLGRYDRALARIDALTGQGKGTAATEQLAILTLEQQGKTAEARSRLRAARQRYPAAADLAGIDAALLDKDGKPAEADKVLERLPRGRTRQRDAGHDACPDPGRVAERFRQSPFTAAGRRRKDRELGSPRSTRRARARARISSTRPKR